MYIHITKKLGFIIVSAIWLVLACNPDDQDDKITLKSPYNGTVGNETRPGFKWKDLDDAAKYELIVANNKNYNDPQIHVTDLIDTIYITIKPLPDDTYYWKVCYQDGGGNPGKWSESWRFTIDTRGPNPPELVTCSNGDTINETRPCFKWKDVKDATVYELVVDQNDNYQDPVLYKNNLKDHDFTAENDFSDGTYYWRVRGLDSQGNVGEWSDSRHFTIDTEGPEPPYPVSYADGTIVNEAMPSLKWKNVSDAVVYELVLDRKDDFSDPELHEKKLKDSEYNAKKALAEGTYYWRVRGKDNQGNTGDWSDAWHFTIDIPPPVPKITVPEMGITINTQKPYFQWDEVKDAATYELIVDDNKGLNNPELHENNLKQSSFNVEKALPYNTYYWRVCAIDSRGQRGSWTEIRNFTIAEIPVPDQPQLVSYKNGEKTENKKPSLKWEAVKQAVEYELMVDDNDGFNDPEINERNIKDSDYTSKDELGNGTYYWKVRARNDMGNWGEWSSVWNFKIDKGGPIIVYLSEDYKDIKWKHSWKDIHGDSEKVLYFECRYIHNDSREVLAGETTHDEKNFRSETSYHFTNLPYGKIVFSVRAVDKEGNKSEWRNSSDDGWYCFRK